MQVDDLTRTKIILQRILAITDRLPDLVRVFVTANDLIDSLPPEEFTTLEKKLDDVQSTLEYWLLMRLRKKFEVQPERRK